MSFDRTCGILLHPTSLPGRHGIGTLGHEAYRFIDWLVSAGQSLWQVCPLGPTGFGDSPYQCFSAFAGNPLLVDLDTLANEGLLERAEVDSIPQFPADKVDFGWVITWKNGVLQRAFERFAAAPPAALKKEFAAFSKENAGWLDDFALFMALKDANGGAPWTQWGADLVSRKPAALKAAQKNLAAAIERRKFDQFLFFRQWNALRTYANQKGVKIVGDVPIFVAHDSADTWANPELFYLDPQGNPTVIAGVPPDYFSATGQRWGNPLYRWDVSEKTKHAWWIARLRTILELVDIVRIDHFRGFDTYWEIPATEATAIHGKWQKGPGAKFFKALQAELGKDLPIIAEDLGDLQDFPEVYALRDQFNFPGMKILQFAFGGDATEPFLPHNYIQNCVVYTGTHDNDTTVGWYAQAPDKEKDFARRYLWTDGHAIHLDLIHAALLSVADIAVVPLQDVFGLGSDARMNFPGRAEGNWAWRYRSEALNADNARWLYDLAKLGNRIPALRKARKS